MASDPIDLIVQQRLASVARVVGYSRDGSLTFGTGVYIGDRYVITAKHVLRGCYKARCEFYDNAVIEVIETFDSNSTDQSVLTLATQPSVQPAKIASVDPVAGSTVTLAGFDNGKRLRFFDTQIGVAGRYSAGTVTDAMARSVSGNSGGPVFNNQGEFIGTLWGSDGATTSLVNNQASHRFFREVAVRYPAFGTAYGRACAPVITQPKPTQPLAPIPQAPAKTCDCSQIAAMLEKLISQRSSGITDAQLEKAIESYLAKDPLTITMVVRNADGSVNEDNVDIARVLPLSQLTEEQKRIVRDSLQLIPEARR
jgi:V8-like Glu-specific endopeptidase